MRVDPANVEFNLYVRIGTEQGQTTFSMSPSVTSASSEDGQYRARILGMIVIFHVLMLGDLSGYKMDNDFTSKYLIVPAYPPSEATVQCGMDCAMMVPQSMFCMSGNGVDCIGRW